MIKVLVVEDEELIRRGIVLTVDWAALGCVVAGEAANGEEGLEQAALCAPDLIITDVKMPKMDGIEMLRRLRESGSTAQVMILTAYDTFQYAQSALRLGAADYLVKPFRDGELGRAFRKKLQEKLCVSLCTSFLLNVSSLLKQSRRLSSNEGIRNQRNVS